MLRCEQARDLLGQLLEATLPDEARLTLEEHLGGCAECRETLEALRMIADVLPSLGGLEPPPQLASDLAASPCRRWLGLLRRQSTEIDPGSSSACWRLDGCEACRGLAGPR
jgi:anti-sigma factor RsiW